MNLFFRIQSLQLLMYGWLGICSHIGLCSFMFYFITSSKLIIFVSFYYIVTFNHFFSLSRPLLVPYAHVSVESIDCILLSSFELKTTLLISSVKTLYLSLLNLCCVFNIGLFFLWIFYYFFWDYVSFTFW